VDGGCRSLVLHRPAEGDPRSQSDPILTGEDIYQFSDFETLCKEHAVDKIHPDLATSGGILQTHHIGDMAFRYGVPMAMHFAGTPVGCMACVHCAAATRNFLALENHSLDVPFWQELVTGIEKPMIDRGFIKVPDSSGLGVTLNDDEVKRHLKPGTGYFEPTPMWDEPQSWDDAAVQLVIFEISRTGPVRAAAGPGQTWLGVLLHFAEFDPAFRDGKPEHFNASQIARANALLLGQPQRVVAVFKGAVPRSAIGSKPINAAQTASVVTQFVPAISKPEERSAFAVPRGLRHPLRFQCHQ